MIKCDGIDKKKNDKCGSPAKYIVNIDEKNYYRCGRHSRKMNNKILMENKKIQRKPKTLKSDDGKIDKYDNKNKDKKDKLNNEEKEILYQNEDNNHNFNDEIHNKYKKIDILFTKIDELCSLLNNNTFG